MGSVAGIDAGSRTDAVAKSAANAAASCGATPPATPVTSEARTQPGALCAGSAEVEAACSALAIGS